MIIGLGATTMNIFSNPTQFNGSVHLSDQQYTDLEINGSGHLARVTVTNSAIMRGSTHLIDFVCPQLTVKGSLYGEAMAVKNADISGAFHCKNSKFDVLTVQGSFIAHATKISDRLSVYGSITATDLECPLIEVKAAKIELKSSLVKAIILGKVADTYSGFFNLWGLLSWGACVPKVSEVYLDGSSVDSITFQGLPGRVILSHGARVRTVVNGAIENR